MTEQLRRVIAERPRLTWGTVGPEQVIYHLPAGRSQDGAAFIPVKCGGGIGFHGPLEKVPRSMVCRDCMAGHITL